MKTSISFFFFLFISTFATGALAQRTFVVPPPPPTAPAKKIIYYDPGVITTIEGGLGMDVLVLLPRPATPAPTVLPKMYFSVGGDFTYMNGSSFNALGALAGEAAAEFTFPLGKVRWAQFVIRPTFGGGSPGTMTGSVALGPGFVLNGDPDVRPAGSTRLSIMFAMRGRGTGQSQDLLGLEGKIMADVAVGETGGIVWLIHAAFEGGGSVYQSGGQSQNDGRLFVGSVGFGLRL